MITGDDHRPEMFTDETRDKQIVDDYRSEIRNDHRR